MFLLKIFKNKFFRKGMILLSVVSLVLVAFFLDGKSIMFKEVEEEKVVIAMEVKNKPHRVINVVDVVIAESEKIDKSFAFKENHTFTFGPNDSYNWIKSLDKGLIKNVSEWLWGKNYDVSLKSIYLIGYDHKMYFSHGNVTFDEGDGTLEVNIPEFDIVYLPLFEAFARDKKVGILRFDYSDEELNQIDIDAINHGFNKVITDPEIEKEATEYIENLIYSRFAENPKLEGKLKAVKVNFGGEYKRIEQELLDKYMGKSQQETLKEEVEREKENK